MGRAQLSEPPYDPESEPKVESTEEAVASAFATANDNSGNVLRIDPLPSLIPSLAPSLPPPAAVEAPPSADPEIVKAAGSLERPVRAVEPTQDLAHVPGNVSSIGGWWRLWQWSRHGSSWLQKMYDRHGPVFRTSLGREHMVMVADPELQGRILRNEDRAYSTALAWATLMGGVHGDGPLPRWLVNMDFGAHRASRRLVQPAFQARAVERYLEIFNREVSATVDQWGKAGVVAFKPAVRELFARCATRVFVGIDDPETARMIEQALADTWHAPMATSRTQGNKTWRKAVQGYATQYEYYMSLIPERRKQGGDDLFSQLCQLEPSAADDWDDDALVSLFMSIMAGSFDTTSSASASMGYLLARPGEWQERMRGQSRATGQQHMSYDDARQLTAHGLVWKETLRLYPVAPDVTRRTLREVTLGEYNLPANTQVSVLTSLVGRLPRWWSNSLSFDPGRFSEDRREDRQHAALYMPFGGGAHACIGGHLAELQVKALWHQLLRSYRLRLGSDYEARHVFTPLGTVSGDVNLQLQKL